MKPRISIITVCWNAEKTIAKTIESVVNQTYRNIDYVIVDGASTDNTLNIINKHKDQLGYFISEKDKGIYDAMNKAIDHVKGDVVFFLNSGDSFYDNKVLEDIAKEFDKDPKLSILVGKVQVTKDGRNLFVKRHEGLGMDYILTDTICHQGMFFRKEDLIKHRFDRQYKVCADLDMFLKLFVKDKVKTKYIDRFFSYYPLGGLSSPEDESKIKKIEKEIRKIRIQYYGKLNYIKYEYKKFGLKGLARELLGNSYGFFADIATWIYQFMTRLIINIVSTLFKIQALGFKGNKKTILIIGEFDTFGGTRIFLFQLLSFYKENNFNVIFAAEPQYLDDAFIKFLQSKNIKLERLTSREGRFKKLRRLSILRDLLYEITEVFKLIKRYRVNLLMISIGTPGIYSACLKLPTKTIYFMHTYPGNYVHTIKKAMLRNNLSKKKIIASVSKTSLNFIKEKFQIKSDKYLKLVYNNAGSAKDAISSEILNKDKIVLTVGHVNNYKNPYLWVDIAKKVTEINKDIKFIWLGDGQLKKECEELVKKNPRIEFLGQKEHYEVEEYMAKASIYLQPSKMESFGLSVVEAMRFRKPVIVSDVGGLTEVVDSKVGFVVKEDKLEDYVEKILYLLNNPDIMVSLGIEGRKKFEAKFSKEVWTDAMLKLHNHLLNL